MGNLSDITNLLKELERLLKSDPINFPFCLNDAYVDLRKGQIKPFLYLLHFILFEWSSELKQQLLDVNSEFVALTDRAFVSTAMRFLRNKPSFLLGNKQFNLTSAQLFREGKYAAARVLLLIQFSQLTINEFNNISRAFPNSKTSKRFYDWRLQYTSTHDYATEKSSSCNNQSYHIGPVQNQRAFHNLIYSHLKPCPHPNPQLI